MGIKVSELTVPRLLEMLGKPVLVCESCKAEYIGRIDSKYCSEVCSGRERQKALRRRRNAL